MKKRRVNPVSRKNKSKVTPTVADDALLQEEHVKYAPKFSDFLLSARIEQKYEEAVALNCADNSEIVGEFQLAKVVRLDRGFPALVSSQGIFRAEFNAGLSKQKEPVAIGDWVCVRKPPGHDIHRIECVLERENEVSRWKGSNRAKKQVLASNVDQILIVCPVGERSLIIDRIVRSVVVALDCNCTPYIVLTKVDLATQDEIAGILDDLFEILRDNTHIVLTSSDLHMQGKEDEFLNELKQKLSDRSYVSFGIPILKTIIAPFKIALLLGESGAGKSTLINALLNSDTLEVGAVRKKDAQGKHTTVARRMIKLEGAGIIVDEPGLRTLPLLGHEDGLQKAFRDIETASTTCYFRDCTHLHEPKCAVQELVEQGVLGKKRLLQYSMLFSEMKHNKSTIDPDIAV